MTSERQIEELAKIEFPEIWGILDGVLVVAKDDGYGHLEPSLIGDCPDYLSDHNAIQWIIDGLPEKYALRYVTSLGDCIKRKIEWGIVEFLRATCEQKAEAILKAYDKWEEE